MFQNRQCNLTLELLTQSTKCYQKVIKIEITEKKLRSLFMQSAKPGKVKRLTFAKLLFNNFEMSQVTSARKDMLKDTIEQLLGNYRKCLATLVPNHTLLSFLLYGTANLARTQRSVDSSRLQRFLIALLQTGGNFDTSLNDLTCRYTCVVTLSLSFLLQYIPHAVS